MQDLPDGVFWLDLRPWTKVVASICELVASARLSVGTLEVL